MNAITTDAPATVYIETQVSTHTYTISATDSVSETKGDSNYCGARIYSIVTDPAPAWVILDSTSG